mmetsp:Transcript_5703/g.13251  ORF Transcript_5703/g.13251 Transcript_5703/m.13251 type:complete len:128 (-) Transcript_5703:623-1006(-)
MIELHQGWFPSHWRRIPNNLGVDGYSDVNVYGESPVFVEIIVKDPIPSEKIFEAPARRGVPLLDHKFANLGLRLMNPAAVLDFRNGGLFVIGTGKVMEKTRDMFRGFLRAIVAAWIDLELPVVPVSP